MANFGIGQTAFVYTLAATCLAACQPGTEPPAESETITAPDAKGTPETGTTTTDSNVYDGITEGETIHFTGTEPFWGGEIANGTARYSTPENIDGTSFPVSRFAGNNGMGFSGTMDGQTFDLTVTPGDCSDGMSDRTYPFTATLTVGAERRNGCAWTDEQGFTGPRNP